MRFLTKTATTLAASLALVALVAAPALADDRGDKIIANLKLAYPQLEQMEMTMGEITDSQWAGLQEGSFTMQGNRIQKFLITADDTKLFLISGDPLDVSKSSAEIAEAVAERKAAEAKQAAVRSEELEAAIAGHPTRGNASAPVTIIEFSDFQCPYCTRGATTVEELLEKYPDDIKFVFKHFPLGFHPWAKPAAIASHCASEQNHDAFWTLHDAYFKNQKAITPENVIAKSKEYLAGAGIDMAAFDDCANNKDSEAYKAAAKVVDDDMALGSKHGVSGTPGFFVNGQFINGAQPSSAFEPLIEEAKKAAR